MKLSHWLEHAVIHLNESRIERAHVEARLLACLGLGLDAVQVIVEADRELSSEDAEILEAYLKRRLKGEPFAHLSGVKEFYGLKFKVNKNVLIPRPETESLVDWALNVIEQNHWQEGTIIDLGTGSGCLLISILNSLRNQQLKFTGLGVDVSSAALLTARNNAQEHALSSVINWVSADLMSEQAKLLKVFSESSGPYLVVSNPPYISENELLNIDPAVTKFEPHLALFDAESDGLGIAREALRLALQLKGPFELGFEVWNPAQCESLKLFASESLNFRGEIRIAAPNVFFSSSEKL